MVARLTSAPAGIPGSGGVSPRTATTLGLSLLLFGLLWRTVRYALEFPIWGDEAHLAVNLAWFDYAALTRHLENCQVAPLLFLWGERAAFEWLGPGELALRLLPYLAGMASLLLFWHLAGLVLSPVARLFAVGFLAVAGETVAMATSVKPYSLDLLMALALQVCAVHWLRAPEQRRWLVALVALAPVALLSSYPAVFVAGAVSLVLLPLAWRRGGADRGWFLAYNAVVAGSFLAALAVGRSQMAAPGGAVIPGATSTQAGMEWFWAAGFPPASPLAFPGWFLRQTAGAMTAYPLGEENGGSIATVLLCVAGAAWWARRREGSLLALFTLPLLLTLIAAVLHRYPYGVKARLMQHLAPGICILAGLGVALLLERARRPAWIPALPLPAVPRAAGIAALFLFTLAVGAGGLVYDLRHPYRDDQTRWMRDTVRRFAATIPAAAPVVVCGSPRWTSSIFTWHWVNQGPRVTWNSRVTPAALASPELWAFHEGPGARAACDRLGEQLLEADPSWRLECRIPYAFVDPRPGRNPVTCHLFHFRKHPLPSSTPSTPPTSSARPPQHPTPDTQHLPSP